MITSISELNVKWIKRAMKEDFILDENTVMFVRECDELATPICGDAQGDKRKCDEFINWYWAMLPARLKYIVNSVCCVVRVINSVSMLSVRYDRCYILLVRTPSEDGNGLYGMDSTLFMVPLHVNPIMIDVMCDRYEC
jgi:hypothetical protein